MFRLIYDKEKNLYIVTNGKLSYSKFYSLENSKEEAERFLAYANMSSVEKFLYTQSKKIQKPIEENKNNEQEKTQSANISNS